jgi:Transmembrane family 220, helix
MRSVFRVIGALMAALFVFAAALQYNDPDPIQWAAIYLAAAVASILYLVGRLRWYVPVLIALVALVWAGTLARHVWGLIGISQLFEEWEMANPTVEEGREMYGLLIIAFWMAALAIATLKTRRASTLPAREHGDVN